jgi:hypothetical protein
MGLYAYHALTSQGGTGPPRGAAVWLHQPPLSPRGAEAASGGRLSPIIINGRTSRPTSPLRRGGSSSSCCHRRRSSAPWRQSRAVAGSMRLLAARVALLHNKNSNNCRRRRPCQCGIGSGAAAPPLCLSSCTSRRQTGGVQALLPPARTQAWCLSQRLLCPQQQQRPQAPLLLLLLLLLQQLARPGQTAGSSQTPRLRRLSLRQCGTGWASMCNMTTLAASPRRMRSSSTGDFLAAEHMGMYMCMCMGTAPLPPSYPHM